MPNFAHKTANVSLEHNVQLNQKTALVSRIDYTCFDDRYWWLDGEIVQDSIDLVDASISLKVGDNLEFQLWCKNCGDLEYDSEYAPTEKELFGGAAKDVAYQARGRVYGLKMKYDF